jgi:hypothetical protein
MARGPACGEDRLAKPGAGGLCHPFRRPMASPCNGACRPCGSTSGRSPKPTPQATPARRPSSRSAGTREWRESVASDLPTGRVHPKSKLGNHLEWPSLQPRPIATCDRIPDQARTIRLLLRSHRIPPIHIDPKYPHRRRYDRRSRHQPQQPESFQPSQHSNKQQQLIQMRPIPQQ